MRREYKYLIIGGGLAGVSAIQGIRRLDEQGTIGLLSAEAEMPYHRPPLSKDLLLGKKVLGQIFIHEEAHYRRQNVELRLRTAVTTIQADQRYVVDAAGHQYGYSQLLIATGGAPREFPKGGKTVHYFRSVKDYLVLDKALPHVEDFLVIGAGFIGAELSAGLVRQGKRVTMLFKGKTLLEGLLPSDLSVFVTDLYRKKGVTLLTGDEPLSFDAWEQRVKVTTRRGRILEAGWVIAGIGIEPETGLARSAGLRIDRGIVVDQYLRSSRPGIFAAGDLARFPCEALGESVRFEHWDNASAQGKCAGVNMAGGMEPYVHLPYFYSDLFELGFEAVGRLDPKMPTICVWEEPFRKGVVVYLGDQKVKGVLLWNKPKMLDWARGLITRQATPESVEDLKGSMPTPVGV